MEVITVLARMVMEGNIVSYQMFVHIMQPVGMVSVTWVDVFASPVIMANIANTKLKEVTVSG